jgi:transcriptional regulator with XRE-family HTH domain
MTEQYEKELYRRIGQRLTLERTKRKLTVTAVAKMIDDQFLTVKRIEDGHRFSFHHASWLVDLFAIDITQIMTELKGEYRGERRNDISDFI